MYEKGNAIKVIYFLLFYYLMKEEDFEKLTPDQMFNILETTTADFRFSRHDLLNKILNKLKETKDKKRFEELKKELLVQDLHTPLNDRIPRFHPMMSGTLEDGSPWEYPDLKTDFSEESIEYYKERAKKTSNPILKARYCDFLWVYKKDFEYSKQAIEGYVECSSTYLANNWGIELADSLLRALEIAISINNKPLQSEVVKTILITCDKLKERKDYRFLIDIFRGLLENYNGIKDLLNLEKIISSIQEAIDYLTKNKEDSYNLQREFLRLLSIIFKLVNDTSKKEIVDLEIAKNLIKEAEWKKTHYPNGNLVASSIYQTALKVFQDLGKYPGETEKIKVILQELNKSLQDSFKVIKTEVSIPNKIVEDYLSKFNGKSTTEVIELIATDRGLIPEYKKSQELAEKLAKEFVLQYIFPMSVIKGNLCIRTLVEEKEKLEFNSIKNFQIGYKMMSNLFLTKIFEKIESLDSDYISKIIELIKNCPFINKDRIPLILVGLKSFKEKSYPASIHILLFQVEGILRDLLEGMGVSTFTFKDNEMKARLFSGIVEKIYLIDGMDKDLIKLIDAFLNNSLGDNLRNDVAHSLCKIEEFSKENNLLLILIILKLATYKIIKKEFSETN